MKHQNQHHRRPRSKGGGSEPRNISIVKGKQHEAWHMLFSNYDPDVICQIINEVWLDPRFRFSCDKIDDTPKSKVGFGNI